MYKYSLAPISIVLIVVAMYVFSCHTKYPSVQYNPESYADTIFNFSKSQLPFYGNAQRLMSAPLPNGTVIWVGANANINNANIGKVPCSYNVHSLGYTQQAGITNLLNNGTADFIPSASSNTYYSPISVYFFLDTVYVYCEQYINNQLQYSTHIAKFKYPSYQFCGVQQQQPQEGYIFGYSTVADSALGFVYTYGFKYPLAAKPELLVARYSIQSPGNIWLYNNAGMWYNFANSAQGIFTLNSINFSVITRKGDYALMLQNKGDSCGQGLDIISYYSQDAQGPFNNKKEIYTITDRLQGHSPMANHITMHPWLINSKGEMLCTYSTNGYLPCFDACVGGFMPSHVADTKGFRISPIKLYQGW
jgi:hypothetical protein